VNDNDIQWHGEAAFKPDWTDSSRLVAYTLKKHAPEGERGFCCVIRQCQQIACEQVVWTAAGWSLTHSRSTQHTVAALTSALVPAGLDCGEVNARLQSCFAGMPCAIIVYYIYCFSAVVMCPSAVGGLYVAFNSGHTPKVVELPHWHGRAWKVVIDTGKLAPYDILIPDAELAPEEADQVRQLHLMFECCYLRV
jgi:hypothetical protein